MTKVFLRLLGSTAAILGFTGAASGAPAMDPVSITILADVNRDGMVDDADRVEKGANPTAAAILLPNIGDKARRCPRATDKEFTDAQLEACHDASDEVARAPEYFAPVRIVANAGASASAQVRATGAGAEKIRIFVQRKGRWVYLKPGVRLTSDELRRGVQLGVDARDVVRDASVWDGSVTLVATLSNRGTSAEDRVAMQVAPVILHNHTQKAVDVFVPNSGEKAEHREFVGDLNKALRAAGFEKPARQIATTDNWAQDFVEFGYVSRPGPGGKPVVLRIAIRSPQPTRSGGRALFDLRGPGMGAVQTGGQGYHQVDSFGNLETIPPYEHNGRRYPAGRVIIGDAGDGVAPNSDLLRFFAAQQIQSPLILDTSWLAIGHVDEFVQFLPADTVRGWTIAVKDVAAGLALLREEQRNGHGSVRAFSREGAPDSSIDALLADEAWLQDNELARRKIEINLARLLAETGLNQAEVVRVPGLFEHARFADFIKRASRHKKDRPSAPPPPPGTPMPPETIVYGPGSLIGLFPVAVNGLLLDRNNYIMPRQWGPVIDGVDVLETAVRAVYARAGIRAASIDDWRSHHEIGGEVHCGTNATREVTGDWWR